MMLKRSVRQTQQATIFILILFIQCTTHILASTTHLSSTIQRNLTTGSKIRVPSPEYHDLLTHINHAKEPHYDLSIDTMEFQTPTASSAVLTAKITPIPSYDTGSYHPDGMIVLENSLRGHCRVTLDVANLPECHGCRISVNTGMSCNDIGTPQPDWERTVYNVEGGFTDTEFVLATGPTDFEGLPVVLKDEDGVDIACGILAPPKKEGRSPHHKAPRPPNTSTDGVHDGTAQTIHDRNTWDDSLTLTAAMLPVDDATSSLGTISIDFNTGGVARAKLDVHDLPVEQCVECLISIHSLDACILTELENQEILFKGNYDFIDNVSDSRFSFQASLDDYENRIVVLRNEDDVPISCGVLLPHTSEPEGTRRIRRRR